MPRPPDAGPPEPPDPTGGGSEDPAAPPRGRLVRTLAALGAANRAGRRRVDDARDAVDRHRPRHPFLDVAWRAIERDRDVNGGILAAAVAFRLFLFVIPFVFVLVTGLGFAADASERSPEDLARSAGITGVVAAAVRTAGDLTPLNRVLLLAGGLYATVRAARSTLAVLDAVHALIWEERPRRVRGVRPVATFLGLAAVTVAVISVGSRLRADEPAVGTVLTLLIGVLPLVLWCWASARLPHAEAPPWALLPGAVLMAVGVQVVHLLTVYWLSRQVTNKSETYGALGLSMAVLLWAYVVGRLIVATTITNATVWRRRHPADGGAGTDADAPVRRWPGLLRDELRR